MKPSIHTPMMHLPFIENPTMTTILADRDYILWRLVQLNVVQVAWRNTDFKPQKKTSSCIFQFSRHQYFINSANNNKKTNANNIENVPQCRQLEKVALIDKCR